VALRKNAYISEALIHRLDREQLTPCLINQRNAFTSEVRPLFAVTRMLFVNLRDQISERNAHEFQKLTIIYFFLLLKAYAKTVL